MTKQTEVVTRRLSTYEEIAQIEKEVKEAQERQTTFLLSKIERLIEMIDKKTERVKHWRERAKTAEAKVQELEERLKHLDL